MKGFKQFAFLLLAGIVGMGAGVALMWGMRGASAANQSEHAHELNFVEGQAATCEQVGLRDYWECPDCHLYFADANGVIPIAADQLAEWRVIPKLNHHGKLIVRTEPTCTQDGNIAYYYCYGCGKAFTDVGCQSEIALADTKLDKIAHRTVHVDAQAATCDHDGWHEHYACEICQQKFIDAEATQPYPNHAVIKGGHHTDTAHFASEQAPTCEGAGHLAYYVCTGCGQKFKDADCQNAYAAGEEVIAPKGHRLEYLPEIKATCTTDGCPERWHCLDCDRYFADENCNTELDLNNLSVAYQAHHHHNDSDWRLILNPNYLLDSTAVPYRELDAYGQVVTHNAVYQQTCLSCHAHQGAQSVGSFATLANNDVSVVPDYEADVNRVVTYDTFTVQVSDLTTVGNTKELAINIHVADNYSRFSNYQLCDQNGNLITGTNDMDAVVENTGIMVLRTQFDVTVDENANPIWKFWYLDLDGNQVYYQTVNPADSGCLIWQFDWDGEHNHFEQKIKVIITNA